MILWKRARDSFKALFWARPKYLSWPAVAAVQSSNALLWGQSGIASQTIDSQSKGSPQIDYIYAEQFTYQVLILIKYCLGQL